MVNIIVQQTPVSLSFNVKDIVSHDQKDGEGLLKLSAQITKIITDKITDEVSISNEIIADKSVEIPILLEHPLMQTILLDIASVKAGNEPTTFALEGVAEYNSDAKLKIGGDFSFTIDHDGVQEEPV